MSPLKALQATAAELRLDPAEPATLVVCSDSTSQSHSHAADSHANSPDQESGPTPAEVLAADVPPAFQLRSVAEMLPAPLEAPAGFDLRREATAFAVALDSACPRLGWRANLLPLEHRKSDSRWMYAPTAALAAAVVLLAVAFAVRPLVQDRALLAALESESARLEQIVHDVEQTESQSGHARRRLLHLRNARWRAEADLRVMRELSELVPGDTWLQSIDLNDGGALLVGEAPAAAPLLGVLSGAAKLTDASFTSSLVKTGAGERFQISLKRRPADDPSPQAAAAAAPAAASNPPVQPPAGPTAQPPAQQSETLSTVSEAEPTAAEGSQ
jgi:Tfp pilus assembly protein PilN